MTLLSVILTFVVVGVVLWLINTYVPMQPPAIKTIMNVAVVLILVLWLLSATGLLGVLNHPIVR